MKMKRVLASILMTAVLLLSLLVPAGAQIVNVPKMQCMLWNADENWTNPGDFVLDTENQFEGTGCVSINLNGKVGTVDASVNLPDTFGVDFSIYRTLEFDIYISDFAILDHLSNTTAGGIEFGKYGVEGRLLAWSDIVSLMQHSHCLVEGWNRVVFYLKKTTSVSHTQQSSQYSTYVRIYWEGMTDCEQDWVLKFDNFVTNDGFANYEVHASGEWQHDEEYHWRNCSVCGVADKYGHYDVYARCEENRTCSLCSFQYEPREHAYTELVEISPATCTRRALYDYACRFCGQRQNRSFLDGEPLGHRESEDAVSLGECGHVYTCVGCDKNMGEMSEHDLYEWKVLREASPTENGLEKRQCAFCTYSETREIAYVAPEQPSKPVAPSDDGCASVVVSGVPILAVIGLGALVIRKKK
jgi:hypothetical protein